MAIMNQKVNKSNREATDQLYKASVWMSMPNFTRISADSCPICRRERRSYFWHTASGQDRRGVHGEEDQYRMKIE